MTMLPDHLFVFFFAVVLPLNGWRNYPKFLAVLEREPARTRFAVYAGNIIALLALTLLVLCWWFYKKRPFSEIGLLWSPGQAFIIATVAVSIAVIIGFLFLDRVARFVRQRPNLKRKLSTAPELLPRTSRELRLFLLMSFCAGICEEILFRGYLIWYLGAGMDITGAILLSSVIFGFCHAYQGKKGVFIIMPVGLVLAILYVWTGSLWAPVLLHIAIDGWSGIYGLRVFGGRD
jgi:membrane protease YdiL (CAAX protease family)